MGPHEATEALSEANAATGLGPPASRKRRNPKNHLGDTGGVYYSQARSDGRVVPLIVLPKILKSDVRRQYAGMFRNVFNSCDPELMRGFMGTFFRPTATFRQEPKPCEAYTTFDVVGAHAIGCYWDSVVATNPDISFSISGVRLRARSDGTAAVEFQFVMEGSVLVPITGPYCEDDTIDDVTKNILSMEQLRLGAPMRTVTYSTKGRIAMLLDSNNAVEFMEMADRV